ncbi:hypothetical protein [Streptomyces mayteni]
MKKRGKLIVAVAAVAALAMGGAGAAFASEDGGNAGEAQEQRIESNKSSDPRTGPEERGLTDVTEDDGQPSFNDDGAAPSDGGEPETHYQEG